MALAEYNILAFFNPKAQTVDTYEPIGSMTSLMLTDIIDNFFSLLTESVVFVVLNNTPIHVSKAVKERREYWENRGLTLCFLPRSAFRDTRQN